MAARKILPEVQAMFDQYAGVHKHKRRLTKDEALDMLHKEFSLTQEQAVLIFGIFRYAKDQNDELSMWEFQQFYTCMGKKTSDYLELFKTLEMGDTGQVDIEKTWDSMKTIENANGETIDDDRLAIFMKGACGEERAIDIVKFINLICRIRLCHS